jgi:hypothetical protein
VRRFPQSPAVTRFQGTPDVQELARRLPAEKLHQLGQQTSVALHAGHQFVGSKGNFSYLHVSTIQDKRNKDNKKKLL